MEGLLVRNLPRARTQDTRLFLFILVVAPVSSGTISLEALLPQMLLVCGPSRSHPFLLFDNLLPQSHLFLQPLHVERLLFTLRITKLIIKMQWYNHSKLGHLLVRNLFYNEHFIKMKITISSCVLLLLKAQTFC